MEIVAVNPGFETKPDEKVIPAPGFVTRHKKLFKTLGALGVLAVAGCAGYLAASSGNGTPASTAQSAAAPGGDEPSTSSLVSAQQTVKRGFQDPANVALDLSKLSIEQLDALLDSYEKDKEAWTDQYLSPAYMESFLVIRNKHKESLGDSHGLRRQLAYDSTLVNLAYEQVENADYSNAIKYSDDHAIVYESSGYCWVVLQESNSAADWASNLDLGSEDIKSIKAKSGVVAEECGCASKTLWWCSRYKSCHTNYVLGQGYDGFVKPYEAMKAQISSRIDSQCSSGSTLAFAGYSRGGGIAQILAYAYYVEGLWPVNRLKLVTFGSPRSLEDRESDTLHGKFEQYRLVYKKDPVPSLPYGWMGYKHVGEMTCIDCGYAQERDAPYWSWPGTNIAHHLQYCQYFGNAQCA